MYIIKYIILLLLTHEAHLNTFFIFVKYPFNFYKRKKLNYIKMLHYYIKKYTDNLIARYFLFYFLISMSCYLLLLLLDFCIFLIIAKCF